MATTTGSYGDKFAPRFIYIRQRVGPDAGKFVYHLETRTAEDAQWHAARLVQRGDACTITEENRGPVVVLPSL